MPVATLPSVWDRALDEVASGLLREAEVAAPPVDCFAVARRLEIAVAFDGGQAERARQKRIGGRDTILLRPEERAERLQWAAAHELGEIFAWRVFESVDEQSPDAGRREQVANLMASRLLLPGRWFFVDAERLDGDLLELKSVYATASHELIALRLLDLGHPMIVTVFDLDAGPVPSGGPPTGGPVGLEHSALAARRSARIDHPPGGGGRLSRRTANFSGPAPPVQPAERACRAEVHSTGRPAKRRTETLLVRGWPVHEPGWKREILLTTPAGDLSVPLSPEPPPGDAC